MLCYRLYFMPPSNGHIERVAELEAPEDVRALGPAREHIGENPLELWNERRKVHRIEAFSDDAACRIAS